MTPIPPAWAMAMASRASVTVSMAEDRIGTLMEIDRVTREATFTSLGSTLDGPGRIRTSSKVSAMALTFDDVLIRPGPSNVLPNEVNVASRVTRSISINVPILSSAMDTVTEARLAIAMAQAGGIGVIHRNMDPEEQAAEVAQVKKFESGMVVNPVTIYPDATLADALKIMADYRISGIPVVEPAASGGRDGKLVGILTNRDVRFATNPGQRVAELMTKEKLVTVTDSNGDMCEAKRLLHQHRIEKLLVVDEDYRCVGLITVKDIEKARAHPDACKDEQGRLRVAAATSVGDSGFARAEALIDAGVDLVVWTRRTAIRSSCSIRSRASSVTR